MVLAWVKAHGACQAEGNLSALRSKCDLLANIGLKPWWLWGFLRCPGVFCVALAAQGAGRARFPATAPVPVFEASVWKKDAVFASFLEFLENKFGLCRPSGVFVSFLETLQTFGVLHKTCRFFASFLGSLQAWGSMQSHRSNVCSGENIKSFLGRLWQSTRPLQCLCLRRKERDNCT